MDWLQRVLGREIDNLSGDNSSGFERLYEELSDTGISKTTLRRWWQDGSKFEDFEKVLKKLGYVLDRSAPDWRPEFDGTETLPVEGQVAAGQVTLCGEVKSDIPVSAKVWSNSQYHSLTTGNIILLEVVGDSMFPDYRHGEYIACRAPRDIQLLQTGTPCVFQEGDNFTFKILRRSQRGDIIGQPINTNHDVIIFDRTRLRIPYVVLGKIDPGK